MEELLKNAQRYNADLLLKVAELELEKNNLAKENKRLHAGFIDCMNTIKSLPTIAEDEIKL